MAKDYKNRSQDRKTNTRRRRSGRRSRLGLWRVLSVIAVILIFSLSLVYLSDFAKKATEQAAVKNIPANQEGVIKPPKPDFPQYTFYKTLPDKEIVIPENEVKIRSREESVGKNKKGPYVMQAGSFATGKEAEALTKKLTAMGIHAKIDKITIMANKKVDNPKLESKTWYRVKIGPYSKMSIVDALCARLKKNGIEVMITESGH